MTNSLASSFPDLALEWHTDYNMPLSALEVSPGSGRKVWWKCSKEKSHVWEATIASRTRGGNGCPFCSGKKVHHTNCLKTLNPELASEWHPDKNGTLSPEDVTPGSGKKVWWKCPNGDDHEWKATVNDRNNGSSCPFCSGRRPSKSNCLAMLEPEIAKEWHHSKNGSLTPLDVTKGSNKKVWWKCLKADDHEYEMPVVKRAISNQGCPFCSGQRVTVSTSIAKTHSHLINEWHPTKNGSLTPKDITKGSNKKVWWKCPMADDHEYKMSLSSKVGQNQGCPMCSGKIVVPSNCLATTHPHLAKEWHPNKNGSLTPKDITKGSNKKVWWKCPMADDHEWINTPNSRTNQDSSCPFCTNRYVSKTNNLESVFPDIAKQWHPTKNGSLEPSMVLFGSHKKVWWKCPKGDDHEWKANIVDRQRFGCAVCSGKKVVLSTCLATQNPKLASEWHPTKNIHLTPYSVVSGSKQMVWWKCPKGDDHEWKASVGDRNRGAGCPVCANYLVVESNALTTTHPQIAKQWHPIKNGSLTANDVSAGSRRKIYWVCSRDKSHVWQTTPHRRTERGDGCPFCSLRLQSKQELSILFELKSFFPSINPYGEKLRIGQKLLSVDIFIPEISLIIELDGHYWHADKQEKDRAKTLLLKEQGLNVIRIREKPLEPLFEEDFTFKRPFRTKRIVDLLLSRILGSYTLSSGLDERIKDYLESDRLQNKDIREQHINNILALKYSDKHSTF